MHNRLSNPKKMAEFLSDHDINVIFIDNNSTYQPLLNWYEDCPYKVYRLKENLGHKCLYRSGILNDYKDQHYILTDPDLDIYDVPDDFLNFLMKGFKNVNIIKSGFSLKIDDLPKNDYTKMIYDWEIKFWQRPQDEYGFYFSELDTTFAIYDRNREWDGFMSDTPENMTSNNFFQAVRSPEPYSCRHLPWYITPDTLSEEEVYYMKTTGTYWSSNFRNIFKDELKKYKL
jgi:hypothetical protein